MRHGTYSIAARDAGSGELGVAVQSHWFSVGSVCSWVRAGVGAVATQSVIEPAYGPRGLDGMAAGATAAVALRDLLADDVVAAMRQVAFVDARGEVSVHTGDECIPCAGHAVGDGVTCQANMMLRDDVPVAMLDAYRESAGPLADRLLAALQAAEAAGGDLRGRQSAALVVAPPHGEPWLRSVDVRVDDHEDPLGELARLLRLQRAYGMATAADELQAAGHTEEAASRYREAAEIARESDELLFWAGLAVATEDVDAGVDLVRRVLARNPRWRVMLDRVSPGFAPAAPVVREALGRT